MTKSREQKEEAPSHHEYGAAAPSNTPRHMPRDTPSYRVYVHDPEDVEQNCKRRQRLPRFALSTISNTTLLMLLLVFGFLDLRSVDPVPVAETRGLVVVSSLVLANPAKPPAFIRQ